MKVPLIQSEKELSNYATIAEGRAFGKKFRISLLSLDIRVLVRCVRFGLRPQPVNATHSLNFSAGVANSSVLRGRSLT